MNPRIPLTRPSPVRLSESLPALREMEQRAIFSNFGPLNTSVEHELTGHLFDGVGECLTVCNATLGIMLAIRHALESRPRSRRRFALMPSFTFAAAAQAAQWNRLTPLFTDIDPRTWAADRSCEEEALAHYASQIAVIVPYATFGYDIDLDWYQHIQDRYDIPVVVDAAASLGTRTASGRGFAAGYPFPTVFSMHATKSFSTAEGGLVYSSSPTLIRELRAMSNFGFGEPRNATSIGLNAKMSEVSALLTHLRLRDFDAVIARRAQLMELYRALLPTLTFQHRPSATTGEPLTQAHQFIPVLLPRSLASRRTAIQVALAREGIATATYFSPHVAQQDYFRANAEPSHLPVTDDVAARILSLPLFDAMTDAEVHEVCSALTAALAIQ